MAKQEKQYLEQMPGGRWRVTIWVPENIQPAIGKTRLKEALETDSLAQARQLRWPVVSRLKAQIEEARIRISGDDIHQAALTYLHEYRRELSCGHRHTSSYSVADIVAEKAEEIAGMPIAVGPDGEYEYDPQRESQAKAFYEIATGKATPLDALFERFASDKSWDTKTFGKLRHIAKLLTEWCRANGHPSTIEHLSKNKRIASEFLYEAKGVRGWKANTYNCYVTVLRSYWNWLIDRGYAENNPWERQSIPKDKKGKGDEERPFTDDEVCRLLHGTPSQAYLLDLMWIAAFTGARMAAIINLRIGDIADDCFHMPPTKHEAEPRIVPIHPAIANLILKRTQDKPADDWLFPEVPELAEGTSDENKRNNRAGKLFARYRESLGIKDIRPDTRRSLVNFHSFRRWFITKAFEGLDRGAKGYSDYTIKEVVGHKITDITAGTYRGTSGLEARRACVEAVRVPTNKAAPAYQ